MTTEAQYEVVDGEPPADAAIVETPAQKLARRGERAEVGQVGADGTSEGDEPVDTGKRERRPARRHWSRYGATSVPMEADAVDPFNDDDVSVNMLRSRATALMAKAVRFANELRNLGDERGDNLLDDFILESRISGMSPREIALRIDASGGYSVEEVVARLQAAYARTSELTATEMRALNTLRLEKVLNALYGFMLNGSEGHTDAYLRTIERLNRMYDLEATRSKIEVEIVSEQQSIVFLTVVDAAIKTILTDPRVAEYLPESVVNGITGAALDAAQAELLSAQDQRVVIDG